MTPEPTLGSPPVRVQHLAYTDNRGGAARAAFRLHRALVQAGAESSMHVRRRHSDDAAVVENPPLGGRRSLDARERAERRLAVALSRQPEVIRSANLLPTRWPATGASSTITHLQWIGNGTISMRDVGRIASPLAITLHDMWPFSGAEHYGPDDETARWRTGYSGGRPPQGALIDIDRLTWRRKRRHWPPMHIIAPSSWLADCARESDLMRNWPIHVIPYALDVARFRPRPASEARHVVGLPQDKLVILFGAPRGTADPRKGFDLLADALRSLTESSDVVCAIFGQSAPQSEPRLGLPLHWLGAIDDDELLATAYAAADVMVVPSRQEALGQTATEALACGTPVVAFNATGLRDVVTHRVDGFLAEPYSARDLAAAIEWVLLDPDRKQQLGAAARANAIAAWSPPLIAERHIEVYRAALDESA